MVNSFVEKKVFRVLKGETAFNCDKEFDRIIKVRRIFQPAGCTYAKIFTTAGNGTSGYNGDNIDATTAWLKNPVQNAIGPDGNLYFADNGNHRCRMVDFSFSPPRIFTIAGTGVQGFSGDTGPATSAQLSSPTGLCFDSGGNIYIADGGNNRIRKITAGTGIITTIAGTGSSAYNGDNIDPLTANLGIPFMITIGPDGFLYLSQLISPRIRQIDFTQNKIFTVAGNGTAGFSGDGGAATLAKLNFPNGILFNSAGDLFIADRNNNRVRKVTGGVITTIAGTGSTTFNGEDIDPLTANVNGPVGLCLDASDNLLIAVVNHNRVRKIDFTANTIKTIAGTGSSGYNGDNIDPLTAFLAAPNSLSLNSNNDLFLTDSANQRIRKLPC